MDLCRLATWLLFLGSCFALYGSTFGGGPNCYLARMGKGLPLPDWACRPTRSLADGDYIRFTDPRTGETLTVGVFRNFLSDFGRGVEYSQSFYELAAKRRSVIQREALRYIEAKATAENRATLRKFRRGMPVPDALVAISRNGKFSKVSPEDIIGVVAVSMPTKAPRRLRYGYFPDIDFPTREHTVPIRGVPVTQTLSMSRFISMDEPWKLRHLVSLDTKYTGMLLYAGEAAFETGMIVPVAGYPANVQVDADVPVSALAGKTLSPEAVLRATTFPYADGSVYPVFGVYPENYEMDAFEELRSYYEARGFTEDRSGPPIGNLHHYRINRRDFVGHFLPRAKEDFARLPFLHGSELINEEIDASLTHSCDISRAVKAVRRSKK